MGEGAITGAELDDREGFAIVFPLVLNPLRDAMCEACCPLRGGGEIPARSEDGTGAGVVALRSVKGLGHEVVEAGERGGASLLG